MQVALLANTAYLHEESAMFRQLVVGLIDEQVRVIQVVPDDLALSDTNAFGQVITWRESTWPFVLRRRIMELADPLGKLKVDLIHVLDRELWPAAIRLAQKLERPAVLSVWSMQDLDHLNQIAKVNSAAQTAVIAPSGPMAQAIIEHLDMDMVVEVIPRGIHLGELLERPSLDDQPLCVAVSGNGSPDEDYEALLAALRNIADDYPQSQYFLDGQGTNQHELWQVIKRYELQANVNLVPPQLEHSEILMGTHMLLQPQSQGRCRSLSLQAMGHGLAVLAQSDPWVDHLIDDKTAWLVHGSDPSQWENLIRRVIEQPERSQQLGQRARRWIGEHRLASGQIAATLDLYQRMTGESLKFPSPSASKDS
jgi:glycosyltransferase involved in cell wall biosynthesis